MEKIILFLRQFGILILIGLIGGGVLIYGLWGEVMPKDPIVEIIKDDETKSNGEVVVDVSGSVMSPGVYKLPNSSRIGDAIVMAGGLSATADREWVAKTVNLAEIVKDGGKIYIPTKSEGKVMGDSAAKSLSGDGKVNINMASISELDGLTGIGEVRAKTIVDGRPYGSTSELVSKAKIPQSVYEGIKDQVSVY